MIKLDVYSVKGTKKAQQALPKNFQEKPNLALLAQALRVYEDRRHGGLSKTKTRGEIRSSKRKIWRQKGTGRARHGARSAPIFVGGGKAHGPKGIKRTLSLPKKMRQKALKVALTLKAENNKVVFVEGVSTIEKTKEAVSLINKITGKGKVLKGNGTVTFVLSEKNAKKKLALRNIKYVNVVLYNDLNAYRVYYGGTLIVDKEALGEDKKKKTIIREDKKETNSKG